MVYKYKSIFKYIYTALVISAIWFLEGCSGDSDMQTIYVEVVNFNDSLRNYILDKGTGKVASYKNNSLELLSKNYVTETEAGMHYLERFTGNNKEFKEQDKKVRVEMIGLFAPDSVRYSLQKFTYHKGEWNKVSDMGVLKAATSFIQEREQYVSRFGNHIINTIAIYSFE